MNKSTIQLLISLINQELDQEEQCEMLDNEGILQELINAKKELLQERGDLSEFLINMIYEDDRERYIKE